MLLLPKPSVIEHNRTKKCFSTDIPGNQSKHSGWPNSYYLAKERIQIYQTNLTHFPCSEPREIGLKVFKEKATDWQT